MDYHLNFHQSFAPETEALAQLLRVASEKPGYLTKDEISELTMIPTGNKSGKVIPHILYAETMGLINVEKQESKFSLKLSKLGEVIYEEDPFLVEELTKWICHYELAQKSSSAALWSYLFNYFIPQTGLKFGHQAFENAVMRKFESNKVNFSPLRSCYTAERCFKSIAIMNIKGEEYHIFPHDINRNYRYFYAYVLLKHWEEQLSNQSEVTYNQLTETLGFGKPFLWNESLTIETLEMLQDEGILVINRQLSPITIIKQVSAEYTLTKVYDYLI